MVMERMSSFHIVSQHIANRHVFHSLIFFFVGLCPQLFWTVLGVDNLSILSRVFHGAKEYAKTRRCEEAESEATAAKSEAASGCDEGKARCRTIAGRFPRFGV